jgi:hypothetical protein
MELGRNGNPSGFIWCRQFEGTIPGGRENGGRAQHNSGKGELATWENRKQTEMGALANEGSPSVKDLIGRCDDMSHVGWKWGVDDSLLEIGNANLD